MTSRARRGVPRPACRAVVTSRDLDALEFLAWAGVLATHHFTPCIFPSRRVAERRMRALLDRRLVRARVPALHKDTIFVLSAAGVRVLEETRELEHVRRASFPRSQKLEHGLAIRDVFVAFVLEARRQGGEIEEAVFESDGGLAELRALGLVPDLVVQVGHEAGLARRSERHGRVVEPILVEVDLGHERRGVLEHKLARYERYLVSGPGRLLFVAKTARRVEAVAARFADLAGRVTAVVLGELDRGVASCTREVFERAVRGVRMDRQAQLPDLALAWAAGDRGFRVVRRGVWVSGG